MFQGASKVVPFLVVTRVSSYPHASSVDLHQGQQTDGVRATHEWPCQPQICAEGSEAMFGFCPKARHEFGCVEEVLLAVVGSVSTPSSNHKFVVLSCSPKSSLTFTHRHLKGPSYTPSVSQAMHWGADSIFVHVGFLVYLEYGIF